MDLTMGRGQEPYSHSRGQLREIEGALEPIYQLLGGAPEDNLVITASQSEAIATVFHSLYYEYIRETGKNQILIGNLENATTLLSGAHYESQDCIVDTIPVNSSGVLTREILNLHTSPKTCALFLSVVTPLTGVVQPIAEIAEYCHEHGILLHLDVSGAIGRLYFDGSDLPIDYLSCSGEALGGPVDMGVLLARGKTRIKPLIPTASSLNPLRGGQIDLAKLAAMGLGAGELIDEMDRSILHVARLREVFERRLEGSSDGIEPLFGDLMRVAHLATFKFHGVAADLLLYHLVDRGIYASMGGGEVQKLEHILTKYGMDLVEARSALSFAISPTMKEEELLKVADEIIGVYNQLRSLTEAFTMEEL